MKGIKKIAKKSFVLLAVVFFACEAVFLEDITDSVVVVIAPTDKAQVEEGAVNFIWENILDATSYQLQIAKPTFAQASQIVLDTLITKNSFSHTVKIGMYEWRVKAKNSEYETGYTTQAMEVINADLTNAQVELLTPLDKAISNKISQKLTWKELTSATEYRLQIWQPDDQGTNVKDVIVTDNSFTFDFTEGDFVWKVRPQSASQNGKYSSRSISIDSKKPNTPENIAPANNTSQTETTINFTWKRTNIVGTEEIDSIYVFTDASLATLSFKGIGANKAFTKDSVEKNTYHWYVQSFDKAGNESEKSSTFIVEVK
ncbi:hypothetical protein [uncultured Tenacibaculum sp.]|uniref:hypothetical protein n=1 Tax=uncultured Tenacibaculum sp. TaxID=174713 RepID=UPI00262C556C|nr:hypothetical protein [uncultured Tenacibaculum sp.]